MMSAIFVLIFSITYLEIQAQHSNCTTPNGEVARCVSIYKCPVLKQALFSKNSTTLEFVRKSQCGYAENPLVCCGSHGSYADISSPNDHLFPNRKICGYQHVDDRFYNNSATALDEFPWMALIKFKKSNGEGFYSCAGSLITNRYVLTAGHCLESTWKQKLQITEVRLGEHIISEEVDCTPNKDYDECSEPVVDVEVEEIIPHPFYNSTNHLNDIGLIRLKKRVYFSDYVRTICLPLPNTTLAEVGDSLITSGWGQNFETGLPSDRKKRAFLTVISNEDCAADYQKYKVEIAPGHLCLNETSQDNPCRGDSGGPAMFANRNQWHQEGIVSFGVLCSMGTVGVYTRVSNYLDWIKTTVKP